MTDFIAANKITILSPDLLSSLSHLHDLQLYRNKLTTLPPEIGNLRGESLLPLPPRPVSPSPDCLSRLRAHKAVTLKQ
jgi:hypothetical protein